MILTRYLLYSNYRNLPSYLSCKTNDNNRYIHQNVYFSHRYLTSIFCEYDLSIKMLSKALNKLKSIIFSRITILFIYIYKRLNTLNDISIDVLQTKLVKIKVRLSSGVVYFQFFEIYLRGEIL